ncbi:hypothetical protein CBM2592_B100208 [Cupriavidus taiwanensis]|nr:hypothetical protein CBM2588_B100057 [Cupriavidus taiwanensis]SOY61500.1 hypothetical protein CBM2592_B100208 [Cupriavidus taiwanensis]SOY97993.1 hypothetical protein CBM2591_B80208 [Cupriavidus taiwanensis]SOZ31665.1 hypothetical protein CBM2608_B90059 [Cupriavidus taiwanensis]SOZ68315.1 hypothetical protein CBM2617_B120017 [Cupriavidus taiwanensis]
MTTMAKKTTDSKKRLIVTMLVLYGAGTGYGLFNGR